MNEWQAGRSIRAWNDNMTAANTQPVANTGYTPIVPAAPVWSGPNYSGPVFGGGSTAGRSVYRRRDAAPSAVVPTFHMLSATLTVTPGGTIWSIRSSTSLGRSIPSAAR